MKSIIQINEPVLKKDYSAGLKQRYDSPAMIRAQNNLALPELAEEISNDGSTGLRTHEKLSGDKGKPMVLEIAKSRLRRLISSSQGCDKEKSQGSRNLTDLTRLEHNTSYLDSNNESKRQLVPRLVQSRNENFSSVYHESFQKGRQITDPGCKPRSKQKQLEQLHQMRQRWQKAQKQEKIVRERKVVDIPNQSFAPEIPRPSKRKVPKARHSMPKSRPRGAHKSQECLTPPGEKNPNLLQVPAVVQKSKVLVAHQR